MLVFASTTGFAFGGVVRRLFTCATPGYRTPPASIEMLLACWQPLASGFVWPGVAPREYKDGETVPMLANKLSSVRTQIPRSFYALPGCVPHELTRAPESLGEVMNGNVVQNAPFELRFGVSRELVLCKVDLDPRGRLLWAKRVREDYRGHLLLDNLPVATRLSRSEGDAPGPVRYERGYTLGFVREPGVHRLGRTGTAYCHNHLAFSVGYFGPTDGGGNPNPNPNPNP